MTTRQDFKDLAAERLADAKALLGAERWGAAYYLAGYSIECALKACIIKKIMRTDAFPEKRLSERCWTHDLKALLELAGLKEAIEQNQPVYDNWGTVKDWQEKTRYALTITRVVAEEFVQKIEDNSTGVLTWIQLNW